MTEEEATTHRNIDTSPPHPQQLTTTCLDSPTFQKLTAWLPDSNSMLAIQLPVSLPATAKDQAWIMKRPLPSLPQLRDFEQNQASERSRAARREGEHTPFEVRTGNTATVRHGLRTPPSEVNEMNVNPLLVPSFGPLQYKGVPVVASNAAVHQSNLNSVGNVRYTSRAPPLLDTYQHVKRSQSPHPSTGQSTSREQSHHQRNSEGTDIVHYLQIPRSINDSKGSLSEFAAQVRLVPLARPMESC